MEPRGGASDPRASNRRAARPKRLEAVTAEYRSTGPMGRIWVVRLRPLARVTLVFLCWWAIGPWNFAQAKELERLNEGMAGWRSLAGVRTDAAAAQTARGPVGPAARLTQSLGAAKKLVAEIKNRAAERSAVPETGKKGPPFDLSADEAKALRAVRQEITRHGQEVVARLEAAGEQIEVDSLPQSVRARQRQKLTEVKRGLGTVRSALRRVERSAAPDLPLLLAELRAVLEEAIGPPFHNPLDPENLPYRPAEPTKRTPRTEPVSTAAGASVATQSAAASPPTAADLAETPEVQLTDGITALAESLGSDPLAIYNWVRQNIRFVPTFGSIQGAEACRLSEECNAFDTASLLIALLRTSGVPARYVRGTVEVEPELFRSALGDFTDTVAAARLAASGGIPTAVVRDVDGEIRGVQIEHVWVEALVGYSPGRAAAAEPPDAAPTWVPMDAAVKRTRFQEPLDVVSAVGADFEGLLDDLAATGTEGHDGASVTGFSETLALERLEGFQESITDFIANDLQDATGGELLGAVEIEAEPFGVLPGSLPARPLVVTERTPVLTPDERHLVTIRLVGGLFSTERLRYDTSTVELAGKRVTLGYRAATEADLATVESFGGLLETPPYLVDLTPVVYVEGEVVATGPPVVMGTHQRLQVRFREPGGRSDGVQHLIAAGSYAAIGLDLQRVSDTLIEQRSQKLAAARDLLGETEVPFDDVMGEVLHLHGLTYFLQVEANKHVTAHRLDVVAVKRPVEMLTTFAPVFATFFGVAVDVVNTGMNVDVRRQLFSVTSRTGDRDAERLYRVASGTFGSLAEGAVFEQVLRTEAVSAMGLIAEANRRDIPVFLIDDTNVDAILPQLDVTGGVVNDIRNAVAAGKQVFVPQRGLSFFDWRGVGYVVRDVATGAAAYLISGGLAGGATAGIGDFLATFRDVLSLASAAASIASLIFGVVLLLEVLSLILATLGVIGVTLYVYNETDSVLSAIDALLVAAMGAIYLAATAWALGFTGVQVFTAIFFFILVTLIVSLIVLLLVKIILLVDKLPEFLRALLPWGENELPRVAPHVLPLQEVAT